MSEVCRDFGISRKTGYKIFNRYKHDGLEAYAGGRSCSHVVRYVTCKVTETLTAWRPLVMFRYTCTEFPPLALFWNDQERYKPVRTLKDAAEMLITRWPNDDGEEYIVAVKACLDAINGLISPAAARDALIRAAQEAGIRCLSVVH